MTTYPEERVLKSLDPVPDDVNEWPDFALREVKIFHQGKGRYADLVEAADDVPLCVLGELMPLEDELEHLSLLEDPTYARMKIDNVTSYSFGQNDEGKPVLWAAGKAGWYEITPSDRYASHYCDTTQAIDMFYFMVDQHQRLPQKRKRLGFMIDPFLRDYQKHTDYRVDDDDEAMEILHKHHSFLLKQMVEQREGIDWSQTHLWKHLAETYGEEIEIMQTKAARHNGRDSPMTGTTSSNDSEESDESEAEGGQEQERDKISRDAASSPTDESDSESSSPVRSQRSHDNSDSMTADESEPDVDWTRPIWLLLNELRKTPSFGIKTAGVEDLAREVVKLPDFHKSHKAASKAIEKSAEPLLRLMNEAKLRKKFNWSTRAIYAELEATLADEVAEEIRTPAPTQTRKKHRLKSVLRPSGASKANKRTSTMPASNDEDEDAEMMDQDAPQEHPQASRRKRMANGQRGGSIDSNVSHMDSPSRQLNGHFDVDALPELAPAPEAQEMLDLVRVEAKKQGRAMQVSHLEAMLGRFGGEFG